MQNSLIDTHCHLESFVKNGTLDAVLKNALNAGVNEMITIGTDPEDWAMYRELAIANPGMIHYTLGLHPCQVEPENFEANLKTLDQELINPVKPVAIGEIGLDYYHLPKDETRIPAIIEAQKQAFAHQLRIAKKLQLPVVVHSRNSFDDCITCLKESEIDPRKVIFHCFSEGAEQMQVLIDLGYRASFTGIITYKNAHAIRAAAILQGLDKLILETDAPYLTPEPIRSKPNEPANVSLTATYCAELFQTSLSEVTSITTQNAKTFFHLLN